MKEVVSAMDTITTSSAYAITRHNKCYTRFTDKLVLKKDFDNRSIINIITCSILESYYD